MRKILLSTRPGRIFVCKLKCKHVRSWRVSKDSKHQRALAVSPCTGCFSPRNGLALPPNGRQKKSPRRTCRTAGKDGSNVSSAQGATEYGLIFRLLRSKVTGPRCPPFSVTNASTSSEASRQEGW